MTELVQIDLIPDRAMVVCAHPDDAELHAGATLAKWIELGAEVTIVVCTNGAAGSGIRGHDPVTVAQQRNKEQHKAAAVLGVQHIEMLGFADGGLEDTPEFRGAVVRLIRQFRPVTLLTHDPAARKHFVHRDHRIAGTVALDAVYPYARDCLHYPEHLRDGLEPHKVQEVLLWESDEPDVIVDVSGHVAAQARSLACHQSQLPGLDTGSGCLQEWLEEKARASAGHQSFELGAAYRRMLAPR